MDLRVRDEFHLNRFCLTFENQEAFSTSQWRWPRPVFVIYRLVAASYVIGWNIYGYVTIPTFGPHVTIVFYTNWSYLILALHLTLALLVTLYHSTTRGKHQQQYQQRHHGSSQKPEVAANGHSHMITMCAGVCSAELPGNIVHYHLEGCDGSGSRSGRKNPVTNQNTAGEGDSGAAGKSKRKKKKQQGSPPVHNNNNYNKATGADGQVSVIPTRCSGRSGERGSRGQGTSCQGRTQRSKVRLPGRGRDPVQWRSSAGKDKRSRCKSADVNCTNINGQDGSHSNQEQLHEQQHQRNCRCCPPAVRTRPDGGISTAVPPQTLIAALDTNPNNKHHLKHNKERYSLLNGDQTMAGEEIHNRVVAVDEPSCLDKQRQSKRHFTSKHSKSHNSHHNQHHSRKRRKRHAGVVSVKSGCHNSNSSLEKIRHRSVSTTAKKAHRQRRRLLLLDPELVVSVRGNQQMIPDGGATAGISPAGYGVEPPGGITNKGTSIWRPDEEVVSADKSKEPRGDKNSYQHYPSDHCNFSGSHSHHHQSRHHQKATQPRSSKALARGNKQGNGFPATSNHRSHQPGKEGAQGEDSGGYAMVSNEIGKRRGVLKSSRSAYNRGKHTFILQRSQGVPLVTPQKVKIDDGNIVTMDTTTATDIGNCPDSQEEILENAQNQYGNSYANGNNDNKQTRSVGTNTSVIAEAPPAQLPQRISVIVDNHVHASSPPATTDNTNTQTTAKFPFYLKVSWVAFNMAAGSALLVSGVYFLVLFPMMQQHQPHFRANILDLNLHGINTLIVLLELMLTSFPVRILHFLFPLAYGLSYVLFSVAYWALDKDNNILYPDILDWNNPTVTVPVVLSLVGLATPVIQLICYGIYRFRVWLFDKLCNNCGRCNASKVNINRSDFDRNSSESSGGGEAMENGQFGKRRETQV